MSQNLLPMSISQVATNFDGPTIEESQTKRQTHDRRRRLWLLSSPRTCSNLLVHMLALEDQPDVVFRKNNGYFFLPMINLKDRLRDRGKRVEDMTSDERKNMMDKYQECFNSLEELAQTAKDQGKIAFVKEHIYFMSEPTTMSQFLATESSTKETPWTVQIPPAYGERATHSKLNKTVLPDEVLKTWLPTFLIRHPALVFPSDCRTMLDVEGKKAAQLAELPLALAMTYHWTRASYEWFAEDLKRSGFESTEEVMWPLVLDADDIITTPDVVDRFAELVGLDPTKLRRQWSPATEKDLEQLPQKIARRMRDTLLASNGIMKEKAAVAIDIDVEAKKWREEFGDDVGKLIEGLVRKAMPDYEFLRSKRLRSTTVAGTKDA
jgi:hypothetical protein